MGDLRLHTYKDVARVYGVTTRTVRAWAAKGAIDVVRTPSGRPRVRLEAAECGSSGEQCLDQEATAGHDR